VNLNHINLPVDDVAANRDFFKKYFDMVTVFEVGKPTPTGVGLADKAGTLLNLTHFDEAETAPIVYHRDFHVGFFVETDTEVDELYARILADEVAVDEAPRKEFGRYTFYIKAPGGFDVEVACLGASLKRRTARDEVKDLAK
jgi:catechol 2,3-dioxygenase-like lactoylglutathione lyase family enzyme